MAYEILYAKQLGLGLWGIKEVNCFQLFPCVDVPIKFIKKEIQVDVCASAMHILEPRKV
jgi:hypothetical protein